MGIRRNKRGGGDKMSCQSCNQLPMKLIDRGGSAMEAGAKTSAMQNKIQSGRDTLSGGSRRNCVVPTNPTGALSFYAGSNNTNKQFGELRNQYTSSSASDRGATKWGGDSRKRRRRTQRRRRKSRRTRRRGRKGRSRVRSRVPRCCRHRRSRRN